MPFTDLSCVFGSVIRFHECVAVNPNLISDGTDNFDSHNGVRLLGLPRNITRPLWHWTGTGEIHPRFFVAVNHAHLCFAPVDIKYPTSRPYRLSRATSIQHVKYVGNVSQFFCGVLESWIRHNNHLQLSGGCRVF